MEAVCQYAEQNKSLTFLDVSHNSIEDRGLLAIANLIKQNSTLQTLVLVGNRFQGKALPKLTMALTTNDASHLFMILIGDLSCTSQEFDEFIRTGVQFAVALRYLYVTTPHFKATSISLVN